jgi:hypothetical protein
LGNNQRLPHESAWTDRGPGPMKARRAMLPVSDPAASGVPVVVECSRFTCALHPGHSPFDGRCGQAGLLGSVEPDK